MSVNRAFLRDDCIINLDGGVDAVREFIGKREKLLAIANAEKIG